VTEKPAGMTDRTKAGRMTPRTRLLVVGLSLFGLAIAAVIVFLPARPQALAISTLVALGFFLASVRAALGAIVAFNARRRRVSGLYALLAVMLFLLALANLAQLRALAQAG
jgi:hypothetical protein